MERAVSGDSSESDITLSYVDDLDAAIEEHLRAESYVMVLAAGDTFSPQSFDQLLSDRQGQRSQQVYVLREGSYKYRLNRNLGRATDGVVRIDDERCIWAGATPMLMSAEVFRAHGSLDVNGDSALRFAEVLLAIGSFGVLSGSVSTAAAHEDELYSEPELFTPEWYLAFVERWAPLLEEAREKHGGVPLYLQRLFVYLLLVRIKVNIGRRDKRALTGADLDTFYADASRCLQSIEDEEILSPHLSPKGMLKAARVRLLQAKYGAEFVIAVSSQESDLVARLGELEVERASALKVAVEAMDIAGDELVIAGKLQTVALGDFAHLRVRAGKHSERLEDDGRYSEQSVFGEVVSRYPTFTARLPLSVLENATSIVFELECSEDRTRVPLNLEFRTTSSRLSRFPGTYWPASRVLLKRADRSLSVRRNTRVARAKAELRLQANLLRGTRVEQAAAALRLVYFLTRFWFKRKPVWIYYDRIVRGGDNADYAHAYASQQNDGIEKHYVLMENTPDAERFREEGRKFLPHKSLKHRLLFLNSEIVFGTHLKPATRNAFSWNDEYFRDLFRYKLQYLNHGLVLDRLDYVLHKRADNADLMCVVSPLEQENLLQPSYGYQPEEVVVTGFARYDGMESRGEKQLLLAPTWRIYLNRPQVDDRLQAGSNGFTDSEYFTVFNSLINNPRLIEGAKRHGYKIVYLLHPNTSSHLGDYEVSDECVEVLAASEDVSYEQVMNDSALMITDYSGVQFDFAYTNKPVVYYQPPSLPPHYSPGNYSYERDGFGEIVEQESELVELLIDYMENDCALRPEYRERVERFFVHQDRENSRRVYEAALQLRERR